MAVMTQDEFVARLAAVNAYATGQPHGGKVELPRGYVELTKPCIIGPHPGIRVLGQSGGSGGLAGTCIVTGLGGHGIVWRGPDHCELSHLGVSHRGGGAAVVLYANNSQGHGFGAYQQNVVNIRGEGRAGSIGILVTGATRNDRAEASHWRGGFIQDVDDCVVVDTNQGVNLVFEGMDLKYHRAGLRLRRGCVTLRDSHVLPWEDGVPGEAGIVLESDDATFEHWTFRGEALHFEMAEGTPAILSRYSTRPPNQLVYLGNSHIQLNAPEQVILDVAGHLRTPGLILSSRVPNAVAVVRTRGSWDGGMPICRNGVSVRWEIT